MDTSRPWVAGALLVAIIIGYVVALIFHLRSERKSKVVVRVLPPVPPVREPATDVIPAQRSTSTRAIPRSCR